MLTTNGARSFDLDRPLNLPSPLSWRQVDERLLCIAPEQPNWLVTDRAGATLLAALSWGETLRAALSFAAQTTGESPETLTAALTTLLTAIEQHGFYADAERDELDIRTARRILHIYLTHRCNLRCAQCYMAAGEGHADEELPVGGWRRVLDAFTDLYGPSAVSFSGGEPLLRPDLLDLAGHARARGHYVTIFTNGTLVRAEVADRLAGACDCVQLSLDGATVDVHDAIRGRGSFAATVSTLGLLHSAGVRLRIALTVMPENAADLANNLIPLLQTLGGTALDVVLNNALPEGRASSGRFCPEPQAMQDAVSGILGQLWTAGWPRPASRRRRAPHHNCGYGGGFILGPNGDVYPCPIMSQAVGNVRSDDLADLAGALNQIFEETAVDQMAECRTCDLRLICAGGCRRRNLRERGNLLRPSCTEQTRNELYRELAGLRAAGKGGI
jgi:radical SAM protein with 4Fe4S-binding SPASM domain